MDKLEMTHGCTPTRQLTVKEANELFTYDKATGFVSWRQLKVGSRGGGRRSNPRPKVFAEGKARYMRVKVNNITYRLHVVVWNMHHGLIPDGMTIDHIDRDPANNRLDNLRMVDMSENNKNRDFSGFKGMTGKRHSEETKSRMSADRRGVSKSVEHRRNIGLAHLGRRQDVLTCPHCGKEGGRTNMKRYHFSKCKNV